MDFAFYDGSFLPLDEVRFSVDDRAFFFGDGVYDAMVGNQNKIYLFRRHLARFFNGLSALSLRTEYSEEKILEILQILMKKSGGGMCFLYIQASRRKKERRHAIGEDGGSHFFAYAKSFPLPDENQRLSLVTVEDTRYALCNVKTINLLPNVLAATYAEQKGADEAIFVKNGIVRECSHSNISILREGRLITHPLDCHILPGTMREVLIRAAKESDIPVEERPFTVEELLDAEGVLVTSTTRRVALAGFVDNITLKSPSALVLSLHKLVNCVFFETMGISF